MTYLRPVNYFSYGNFSNGTFTPLQQAIVSLTKIGTLNQNYGGSIEIKAPLACVSEAVESAFVLVEKATLPKIAHATNTLSTRMFTFAGDPFVPYSTNPSHTAEQARKTAAKWLSIAAHLEAEEKAKAAEAKKKADAEAAAKKARTNRLADLAYEYFDAAMADLGPKKTRVIEDLYDLQEKLKTDGEAA